MNKAKSIKSDYFRVPQYYNLTRKEPLGIDNVISITDYTDLWSELSASFRKINPYKTLSSIISRKGEFWWWSRTLRETVELFSPAYPGILPYYTGISVVMTIPTFLIILCSSTSTSVHLEATCKFRGEDGLIL